VLECAADGTVPDVQMPASRETEVELRQQCMVTKVRPNPSCGSLYLVLPERAVQAARDEAADAGGEHGRAGLVQ
jgi:hypothetical protein